MATTLMLGENLVALFQLYFKPGAAISKILDRGKLWFALLAALGVSFLMHSPLAIVGRFTPVGAIVVAIVPAIVLCRAIAGFGSFGVLMQSDYVSLLMCILNSWTVAFLPPSLLPLPVMY